MNLVLGSAAYNENSKATFRRNGMALLRKVVSILGLSKGTYNLRYNAAGIACSGDCILHADTFYVCFNLDCCNWVLVRSCKGQKDYTGGPNQSYKFDRLQEDGAEGLASFIRSMLAQVHDEVSR
jgi:hypothetical protein